MQAVIAQPLAVALLSMLWAPAATASGGRAGGPAAPLPSGAVAHQGQPGRQLLDNADFSRAGQPGGHSPAADWLAEGTPGYTLVPGERHGSSGGSIRARADKLSTLAGAVQIFHVPPPPPSGQQHDGSGKLLLRVSGWSAAAGVTGAADADYAISCDLGFADGSHHYGVAIAPWSAGTHDWQQANATYELPGAWF